MKQDENGLDLALQGISGAAEEMDSAPLLPGWGSVASHPSVVGNHDRLQQVVKLGALMGQDASLMELARRMRDMALPDKERQDALIRFFSLRPEMLSQQAGELLGDPVLVDVLLPLMTNLPIDESAPLLFRILPGAGAPRRSRIVDVLVSRAEGAELLVNALEDRTILPNDVSALQARQVFSLDDDDLAKRMEMAWGVSRSAREDLQLRIQDWKSRLTPEELSRADLADGQVVFARACASCHKMFGQGGDLGPELTGSNRSNLDYLLENILDPNAVIPIDAQAVLVTLKDGQVFTGVGGLERGNQVTLRSPAGIMQWPAAKVLSVRPLGFSLMPEGILDSLSAGESRNLIGWLMHGEP
jgi:putative heme-binding domain-containing protein